jgi:drug/metabolite transporter (DMT)-like permease
LRFAVASVLLLGLTYRTEGKLPSVKRRDLPGIALLGLTGIAAYNIFFFKGLSLIEASRASLIVATCPVFIALFSAILFKEKLKLIGVLGIILSVTGAIVVVSRGNPLELFDGRIWLGEAFIFGCVLCWTAYSLIGKAMMKELSPLVLVTYSAVVGTACLFVPALREGMLQTAWSIGDWLCILYMGVFGTVIGFVWYYKGLKKIGPVKAGLFINFVPIWAIIFSRLILEESLTPSLFVGAALVIGGVYLTNKKQTPA